MTAAPRPPSAWWYGACGLLLVLGFGAFLAFMLAGASSLTRGLTQIVVPGAGDVELPEAGTYTIYYEPETTAFGRAFDTTTATLGTTDLVVTPAGGGAPLALRTPEWKRSYDVGDRHGVSLFDFDAPSAGTYHVAGSYAPGETGPSFVIAVGRVRLLHALVTGFSILFGAAGAALILFLVVYFRRRRFLEASI